MDENASRAVFLGVSVFISIITITLIINFYQTAKDSAAVANRFDISSTYNKHVNDILEKEIVNGVELRYLVNYFEDEKEFDVSVYNMAEEGEVMYQGVKYTGVDVYSGDYWSNEHQEMLEDKIRPNYNYELEITENGNKYEVKAYLKY